MQDSEEMTNVEQFSNNGRKSNTKVITQTNHNRSKQCDEPISISGNYTKLAESAAKIARTIVGCDRLWFRFLLIAKLERDLKANH